jgi:hypothetical protein
MLLVLAPDGRYMQMPVEIMHGAFVDFLIPGILLLGLGALNSLAFLSVLRRRPDGWFFSALALGGYAVWFVVEIIILRELHWLHLMWGLPVLVGIQAAVPVFTFRNPAPGVRKGLLRCGLISSAWYVAITIYVPTHYEGYSHAAYTVSELSAIGAPTRILWVLLVFPFPLLLSAFGWGLVLAAGSSRPLRAAGWIAVAYGAFNLYWPPMQMRGAEMALTDKAHIAWAMVTVLMMVAMMITAARALGKQFKLFTLACLALFMLFGFLTFTEAGALAANEPTPMIGVWERMNIFLFLLWVGVLSVLMRRREKAGVDHDFR